MTVNDIKKYEDINEESYMFDGPGEKLANKVPGFSEKLQEKYYKKMGLDVDPKTYEPYMCDFLYEIEYEGGLEEDNEISEAIHDSFIELIDELNLDELILP